MQTPAAGGPEFVRLLRECGEHCSGVTLCKQLHGGASEAFAAPRRPHLEERHSRHVDWGVEVYILAQDRVIRVDLSASHFDAVSDEREGVISALTDRTAVHVPPSVGVAVEGEVKRAPVIVRLEQLAEFEHAGLPFSFVAAALEVTGALLLPFPVLLFTHLLLPVLLLRCR